MARETTDADALRPDYSNKTFAGWANISPETRAQLLLQGAPFPGETPIETRCRLKRDLELYDDDDLSSLLDKSHDTILRMRLKGVGPTPIKLSREIFYARADVNDWIKAQRDVVAT